MKNGYALIATFDPATEGAVYALWDELAQAGISTYMRDSGARPHITLAVFDSASCDVLEQVATDLAAATPPLDIKLTAVGVFPGPDGVVFLIPAASAGLLQLHTSLHAALPALGLASWQHYLPGRWLAHCTVAMGLDTKRMAQALDLCLRSNVPAAGHLDRIAVVQFRPTKELCSFRLGPQYS